MSTEEQQILANGSREEEQPNEGYCDEVNQRSKKKPGQTLVALLLIALLIAAMTAWFLLSNPSKEIPTGGEFYEQSATQIQDAIDQSVEDGYFNMTINSKVPVYDGTTALVGIQNIEGNHFDCTVTVALSDGSVVYQSGGLAPGQELQTVKLNTSLEKGEHEATALFEIYDQNEEHSKAGQTASKITLYVQ